MFPTLLARTILCVAGRIVDRQLTLFMTELVAEGISKCTIHKPPLFFDLRHAHWLRSRLDR